MIMRSAAKPTPHAPGAVLRVATYNIHKGVRGMGPAKRLEMASKLGAAHRHADTVALLAQRAHHVAAEESRAAENGDQRIDIGLGNHPVLGRLPAPRGGKWRRAANSGTLPPCTGALADHRFVPRMSEAGIGSSQYSRSEMRGPSPSHERGTPAEPREAADAGRRGWAPRANRVPAPELTTPNPPPYLSGRAQVAELVDALVSGTSAARRGGSSPLLGTITTPPSALAKQ